MAKGETIVRFEGVHYDFGIKKPILDGVDFLIRRGSKITLMGQNGAGKSTLFSLITGASEPNEGKVEIQHGLTIALGRRRTRAPPYRAERAD